MFNLLFNKNTIGYRTTKESVLHVTKMEDTTLFLPTLPEIQINKDVNIKHPDVKYFLHFFSFCTST